MYFLQLRPKISALVKDQSRRRKEKIATNLQRGMISSSTSRVHREYSISKAVMGWTEWALLIVSTLASDKPMYLIFPSSTSFLSSPIFHKQAIFSGQKQRINKMSHNSNSHEQTRPCYAHLPCPQLALKHRRGADSRDQCSQGQGARGWPRNIFVRNRGSHLP